MSHPTIQAVVLDLGEVLIRLDFSSVMKLRGLGNPSLAGALDHMDKWDIYDAFERGQLSEAQFIETATTRLGIRLERPEFLSYWNAVLRETVPEVDTLIPMLANRIPLYALTNSNETHIRYAKANYPWLSHFKHIYTSFDLGCRKPEKLIYQKVSKAIGCDSKNILFIDDRIENVQGAKDAGLEARHCISSPKDLLQILKSFQLMD